MIFKEGVKIAGARPEIVIAMTVADQVYQELTGNEVTITEVTGGKHGIGSLHYVGAAIDLRIWGLSKDMLTKIVLRLRECLGENYDVVLESDHIHVEFQPK